ncbi:hypothetical protein LWI29_008048 [Acer saccharum]|uniref:Chromo domain-containing protein n=1 Tax=Acer saccharum TaxID=4024 RepID=A0AA39RCW2_ACESA|nr:hypothetical protein LWI29_008048 [Acer saccharum]
MSVHEEVQKKIALRIKVYAQLANLRRKDKQFEIGDQVMILLRSEHFPLGSYGKLHACGQDPSNPVFNVEDLTEFNSEIALPAPLDDTPIRVPSAPRQLDTMIAVLDHQFVSTRRGGYYKFLVRWAHKPLSESVWLQGDEVHHLALDVYQAYLQRYLPKASSLGVNNCPLSPVFVNKWWNMGSCFMLMREDPTKETSKETTEQEQEHRQKHRHEEPPVIPDPPLAIDLPTMPTAPESTADRAEFSADSERTSSRNDGRAEADTDGCRCRCRC